MKFRITLSLLCALGACCGSGDGSWAQEAPKAKATPAPLILPRVLSRVVEQNPELAVSELEIQAAAARVLQAGMKPNPEVETMMENMSFPIVGAGLFHYTEASLMFSQRLELGGKRELRIRAAEKDSAVAATGREVKKTELIYLTSLAFAELLAEQERVGNQEELLRLAQDSYSAVAERVSAGKVSPVEQTRAAVVLAEARLEVEKHKRALEAAKDRLASLWGGVGAEFDAVEGRFEIPPINGDRAVSCLSGNPEWKRAEVTTDARNAALELELANRKPDLTFQTGLRWLNVDREQVWVAGVSIPIPIFDKRQGAIAEARLRVDQSRTESKVVEWRLRAALTQAKRDHEDARLEAKGLNETALPAAKEAAAILEEGYRLGKFDYLNWLDAQRTVRELQGKYIEAVASGLKAAIEIDRIARCNDPAVSAASAR
jgi:cobalt-zinc-cadmium efflux system outer membrane protein